MKGCEIVLFWCFYDNLFKSRFVACMFWCMPSTFMLDWAIWSLYWVLWLLLGVFTNLCCKTVEYVRKIRSIDQSINQSINQSISCSIKSLINQSSMAIYWWLGVEKRRKNSGWGSETLWLPSWVGRNRSITIAGMCMCVSVCVLAFVYMNAHCVCVCVCVCVCDWLCVCAVCQLNRK